MSWIRRRIGQAKADFIVDEVTGKARPRFNTFTRQAYTPTKTTNAQEEIAWQFRSRNGGKWSDFDGEVRIRVDTWRALAKSNPKFWAGRADTSKPDGDNILKIVMDALNGVGYRDDSQVTCGVFCKRPRIAFGKKSRIRIIVDYYCETYRKEAKCHKSK